ncbi:MAG: RIP metalloprotease RseP [Bacteroidota bacterium]
MEKLLTGLVMAGQLALGISLLVGLHEMGHLLAAKFFGMRVEKYSIGFPPKIFGFMWRGTEYSLGAIPLGGFVKISGMIDESMDKEAMKLPPQSWEFRSKPAWQRLIVMLGGIIVNIITGIVIYAGIIYFEGEKYVPASEARYGIVASDLAKKIGLQTGDKIIKVNGKPLQRWNDAMNPDILLGSDNFYTVDRGGVIMDIAIPNDLIDRLSADDNFKQGFIGLAKPCIVAEVPSGYPASKSGILPGDQIIQIDNKKITYFHEAQEVLHASAGKTLAVTVTRNGKLLTFHPTATSDGLLGFSVSELKTNTLHYSFVESVPKGAGRALDVVSMNIRGLGKVFRREVSVSNSFQGPIAMAKNLYGGLWDWGRFWEATGLLSMALAFMNLLPIPALDGGHSVFLLYEMITRRKPGEKFLENAQKVGMVLLLTLMVFVIFNDVIKEIF